MDRSAKEVNSVSEMVRDHPMSTDKLKETLRSAHVDAAPPAALDDTHQQLLSQLQKSSDFDRDYMTIPEKDIPKTKVLLTIVGGRIVHELPAIRGIEKSMVPSGPEKNIGVTE